MQVLLALTAAPKALNAGLKPGIALSRGEYCRPYGYRGVKRSLFDIVMVLHRPMFRNLSTNLISIKTATH